MTDRSPAGVAWLAELPLLSPAQHRDVASAFRRALVESPLPTVLTRTGDGRILGCNEQFQQMLGVDETVVHGQRVEDLVHPDDRQQTSAVLGRLSRKESTLEQYEARWVRPDGRVVWTRRNVLRVDGPAEDGSSYLVAVLEDLTPLRTAQQLASALIDIGGGIAAGASLEETAQRLTTLTQAGWADAGCVLTVLDRDGQVLVPVCPDAVTDGLLADLPEIPVGASGGASGTAAWRDEPTAVPDLLAATGVQPLHEALAGHGVVSSWAVPLHDPDGPVIGTLGLYHSYRYEPSPEDWGTATAVAGVAAIAIVAEQRRQARSREQQRIRTDPRNGLPDEMAPAEHLDPMRAADDSEPCVHEGLWRAVFHDSSLPQAHTGADGTITDVNDALCELVGLPAAELVGRVPAELTHPADTGECDAMLSQLLSGQTRAGSAERVLRHASGQPMPTLVLANAVVVDGVAVGAVACYQDLRLVQESERRLEQQTQMLAALGERSRDVGLVVDADATILYASPAAQPMFGYDAVDLVTHAAWEFVHPDDAAALRERFYALVAAGAGTRSETNRLLAADGSVRWVTVSMTNLLGSPIGGIVCNLVDVTEQREVEAQFRLDQQRNRAIVDNLQEGVLVTDGDGNTVFANGKIAELLGLPLAALYDAPISRLLAEADTERVAERLRPRLVGPDRYDLAYDHPDGTIHHLEVSAVPLAFGDELITGSLVTVTDVTASRALERQLQRVALRDPLTDLPNRTLFMDRLEHALKGARRDATVLLIDLDRFKLVNDVRGHDIGDRVLVDVAGRLSRVARTEDTVARLGGDEFVILCEGSTSAAREMASAALAALQAPVTIDGEAVRVSASIGVAHTPAADPKDLLRFAEAAMFAAKRAGRARVHVFDRALADEAEQAYTLAADLQTALHDDLLDAHYQPIVDLASGRVVGYEMLARWTHAQRGSIAPDVFVPLAEATGLARALDHWAISHGIQQVAWLRAAGVISGHAHVAINLSAKHLHDADLEDRIVAVTSNAEVAPGHVTFEITESAIMYDLGATLRLLERLRRRGYQIAIDDFGTGHSSLAYLKDLPISALKIDRRFITDMTGDNDARAIVASIVQLARAVGVTTIAEGVETLDQAEALRFLGCDSGQGWLWSRAVPVDGLGQVPRRYDIVRSRQPAAPPLVPAGVTEEHGLSRLRALQQQGASLSTIAAALNKDGFRAPNGNRWHPTSVARALADLADGTPEG